MKEKDTEGEIKSVAVVIFYHYSNDGQLMVAMQKRDEKSEGELIDLWEFPGGKVESEKNENWFQAAVREVKEECGIEIHCHDLTLMMRQRVRYDWGARDLYVFLSPASDKILDHENLTFFHIGAIVNDLIKTFPINTLIVKKILPLKSSVE